MSNSFNRDFIILIIADNLQIDNAAAEGNTIAPSGGNGKHEGTISYIYAGTVYYLLEPDPPKAPTLS